MTFASPLAAILVLPLGFVAWRLLRRGRKSGIRFSAVTRIPSSAAGWRARIAALTPYVLLTGLFSLVIAAARPRTPLAHMTRDVDAIAIAMTVDISGSMRATDIAPTRLDAVKRLFCDFVERRPDDIIGLITFGGFASTRMPLTADHEALKHVLKAVEVPLNEDERLTAMGDGIAVALARLKDAKPKSKIIILLSDGVSTVENEAVSDEKAAELAAKMGVRIYIVGIGVVPEVIEIPSLMGTRRVRASELSREQLVNVLGFDEERLKDIAAKTGGVYFPVSDDRGIEKALSDISNLETTRIQADAYDRWEEHFAGFLFVGVMLVIAAVSLSMVATRRLA